MEQIFEQVNIILETLGKQKAAKSPNYFTELAKLTLAAWTEINPHNAMEIVGIVNNNNIGEENIKHYLIQTAAFLHNKEDYLCELKENSARHCYIEPFINHDLQSLLPKELFK